MKSDLIESPRILRALKKLQIAHNAPICIESAPVCCTLRAQDSRPFNYDAARIVCARISGDLLLIDDGARVHYRIQSGAGILRRIRANDAREWMRAAIL